jgi:hypothetical protein
LGRRLSGHASSLGWILSGQASYFGWILSGQASYFGWILSGQVSYLIEMLVTELKIVVTGKKNPTVRYLAVKFFQVVVAGIT